MVARACPACAARHKWGKSSGSARILATSSEPRVVEQQSLPESFPEMEEAQFQSSHSSDWRPKRDRHARSSEQGAHAHTASNKKSMKALLDDLLDFNRTRLGLGINMARTRVDLGMLLADEVTELRAAHPDHPVELEVRRDCRGMWDGRRVEQLLMNLVTNAMKYGTPRALVRVILSGDEKDVRIDVINSGPAIDPAILARIFEPLNRGAQPASADGGLGLGLYIAQEIAKGHGGEITARSAASETIFTARLPRFPTV